MEKQRVVPVLRILDVPKAIEFYIDWLGFTVDWEHRFEENFPLYMQISKDGLIVHLSEHYGDCLPGARLRINLEGLNQFHQQLKPYRYYKPSVEKMQWGTNEMALIDPFGNHIVFVDDFKE